MGAVQSSARPSGVSVQVKRWERAASSMSPSYQASAGTSVQPSAQSGSSPVPGVRPRARLRMAAVSARVMGRSGPKVPSSRPFIRPRAAADATASAYQASAGTSGKNASPASAGGSKKRTAMVTSSARLMRSSEPKSPLG